MTKADIVEDIAQKTGLTKKEVGETVDLFLEEISKLLVDGHHLEIRGFGTFKVKERKERMARNPRTGDAVPVPARRVPVFKVSKMLKDRVATNHIMLSGSRPILLDQTAFPAQSRGSLLSPPIPYS